MGRIYQRLTQSKSGNKKKKNEHARKRNIIMNFRVAPVEKALIDKRCELSGLPRAKFFIESCMYQAIFVKGNARTFSVIRDELKAIDEYLREIKHIGELDYKTTESLRTIVQILDSFFTKNDRNSSSQ